MANLQPIKQQESTTNIYTVPNIITLVRLMLVPFAFSLLVQGKNDAFAFVLFALAGASDFIDGQIARRTNQVSELGKVIDPIVDRFLIVAGLMGLYAVDRIPLWILIVLAGRDFYLMCGVIYLKSKNARRIDVIFIGKLTTTLLLIGFSGLILNAPRILGLSLTDISWLPGFNGRQTTPWIYFVYLGMALSLTTACVYSAKAVTALREANGER